MSNSKPVSIIIVTWNSARHLPRCLSSLDAQTFKDFEIIIVDNGSSDEALTGLEDKYPELDISIKRFESNLGFATANNIGSRLGRGQWLVLLNADAFPRPDWLEQLILAVNQYPGYACFSSRQIQADDQSMLDGEGDAYHITGLAWRRSYNLPVYEATVPVEIFSACGAAMMVRRQDFVDLGGFEESYFSYFEDVDLGFRLRLAGIRTLYLPQAVVYHVGSASTGKRSHFSVYYQYRNMIWTFFKDMPFPLLQLLLPIHIGAILFFALYLTLRGQGGAIWRAIFDALRGLPRILIQRRRIQGNRKAKPKDIILVMSTGLLEPLREFMKRNLV